MSKRHVQLFTWLYEKCIKTIVKTMHEIHMNFFRFVYRPVYALFHANYFTYRPFLLWAMNNIFKEFGILVAAFDIQMNFPIAFEYSHDAYSSTIDNIIVHYFPGGPRS